MPASGEFIDRLADLLVASGFGERGPTASGVSIQTSFRRESEVGPTTALLSQTGGASFPWGFKEEYGVQLLVDSSTVSGAKTTARAIYDFLHETTAQVISGHKVLWLRAIAPPQAIPTGPDESRFQFAVNFNALLVRDE